MPAADLSADLEDILDRLHVVALPMRVRFRGITVRELALIDGPAGLGRVRRVRRISTTGGGGLAGVGDRGRLPAVPAGAS